MARRRERQAVDAGGARSDGGLPAKARRAWGPSFGEGPEDRSAEARNARSRGIGSRSFGEGARQSGGEPDARGHLGHLLFRKPRPRRPALLLFPAASPRFPQTLPPLIPAQPARAAPALPGRSRNFAQPSFSQFRAPVIPAKAGIQCGLTMACSLASGRGRDARDTLTLALP